jgi:hypothetical protein
MIAAAANVRSVLAAAIERTSQRSIAGGERGKMDRDFRNGCPDLEPNRQDAGRQSRWFRAARLAFAALCVVAASLAGSVPGRLLPGSIGTAQGTAPSADAQRDSVRNLLRPHTEIAAKAPIWRAIDAGGPPPDSHSGGILAPPQSVASLAGNEGSASDHDHEPHRHAVRAGYSQAPPTAIGRSRTAA